MIVCSLLLEPGKKGANRRAVAATAKRLLWVGEEKREKEKEKEKKSKGRVVAVMCAIRADVV